MNLKVIGKKNEINEPGKLYFDIINDLKGNSNVYLPENPGIMAGY